jgi:hypothetical protein
MPPNGGKKSDYRQYRQWVDKGDRQGDGSNVYTDLASIVKFRHSNPVCHHKAESK